MNRRILYYHQQSNFPRKIRILLKEKNIDCELKAVNLMDKPPEFLKLSPIAKVPVFVETDGTVIWDSTLIAEYLDKHWILDYPHLGKWFQKLHERESVQTTIPQPLK
jgi:glutathione S-transferase